MALAATYSALSESSCAVEGRFDRTLPVTGPVELNIQTGSGSFTVTAGDNANVLIHGAFRARRGRVSQADAEKRVRALESHPPIEQHGNTIALGGSTDPSLQHDIAISYMLVVPAATRLKSKSGSGDQVIEGIIGPLELSTGSGRLKAANIGGSVQASTGSGEIDLKTVLGDVQASSGSGRIRARGIAGSFRAQSGSGNVILEQAAVAEVRVQSASGNIALKNVRGRVHAKSASGSISAEGGGQEPWRLETVSGDVTVRVPPGLGFDLLGHSVSGNITATRPLTLLGSAHHREIIGRAGNNGFLLDVSTVSGDIHIDWLAAPKPLSPY